MDCDYSGFRFPNLESLIIQISKLITRNQLSEKPFYPISVYLDRNSDTWQSVLKTCSLFSFCWVGHGSHLSSCKPLPALALQYLNLCSLFGGSCLLDFRLFDACTLCAHPGLEHYIFERSWYKYLFKLCHGRFTLWLISTFFVHALILLRYHCVK